MTLTMRTVAIVGLFQFITLTAAYAAQSIAHSTIFTRSDDIQSEYDYVIVGGGTAGLTVADRLTESGRCRSPIHLTTLTNNMSNTY
jgi:hypothetical protein